MSKNTLVSKQYRRRSPFKDVFHRLTKNKGAVVGLCIIGALILLLLASFLIDYSAVTKTDLSNRFLPPSWQHPFGTDDMGRDVFLRVVYGTRYSLSIGFGATALAAIAGVC
ncbi:MAG: ABC transporter permease, partial [Lachnospiraceae bacterium]|nr:ABC transporter permease [Lachnospiraceae bacterium]